MIRVNDKWQVPWREGLSVQDVLEACGFTHHQIVVSIDRKLVAPGDYQRQHVPDGAEVRVVHIIGGG
jgi:thiamine biosynthesis protein ThiS